MFNEEVITRILAKKNYVIDNHINIIGIYENDDNAFIIKYTVIHKNYVYITSIGYSDYNLVLRKYKLKKLLCPQK